MNYIRHLNTFFFQKVKYDQRLTANHVSLYISLFQFWNFHRFQNCFYIKREEVMGITGIGSKNTYHKCLKELHEFGYVIYIPSKNKFQKSKICMSRLDGIKEYLRPQLNLFESQMVFENGVKQNEITGPKLILPSDGNTIPNMVPGVSQIDDHGDPTSGPGKGADMGLLIKHKHINKREREKTLSLPQSIDCKKAFFKKDPGSGLCCKSESEGAPLQRPFTQPEITQVMSFFKKNNFPELEAKKFFNHYQSNGWLVGGVSPMGDWHSSAQKWMLNAEKFQQVVRQKNSVNIPAKTDFTNSKNFSEPL